MSSAVWFAQLDRVHLTSGRVRWRYRCHPDAPQESKDIALAARNLAGVVDARVNSPIRSLIVEFDEHQTDAETLAGKLLALPPPRMLPAANNGRADATPEAVAASLLTLLSTPLLPKHYSTTQTSPSWRRWDRRTSCSMDSEPAALKRG